MIQPWLTPVSQELLFSKNDPDDLRLGDLVKTLENISDLIAPNKPVKNLKTAINDAESGAGSENNTAVILGYPDDEGIKLNGGRVGAAAGPEAIRRALYKMTPSLVVPSSNLKIFDAGNLMLDASLTERHRQARQTVEELLKKRVRVVALGGGHDYGFSDMAAFCTHTLSQGHRPFVVNFDAHLDVRPFNENQSNTESKSAPNSGTPFYRLLNEFAGRIDFFEVGIQDWCNSRAHLEWAKARGARIVTFEMLNNAPGDLTEALSKHVFGHVKPHNRVALSVDIDCFSSASCPGASQVFPTGFMANDFLKAWPTIVGVHKPAVTSFYEVSPPLDLDQRTSRMAAILIHQVLFAN